jgi:2-oxo-4-hydroxy-4-carboxy-5-ureidoimidazoline decarboxylase
VSVDAFNVLSESEARDALMLCCVSERWVEGVLAGRPYPDAEALRVSANTVWSSLGKEDFLQAFEGHPKIGDVNSLKAKYAASGNLAAHEQSGVATADDAVIQRLAAGNAAYEQKFGYIFIVCASGKSADEMCVILENRLGNSPEQELGIAAEEQRKILQIRLEKLM